MVKQIKESTRQQTNILKIPLAEISRFGKFVTLPANCRGGKIKSNDQKAKSIEVGIPIPIARLTRKFVLQSFQNTIQILRQPRVAW